MKIVTNLLCISLAIAGCAGAKLESYGIQAAAHRVTPEPGLVCTTLPAIGAAGRLAMAAGGSAGPSTHCRCVIAQASTHIYLRNPPARHARCLCDWRYRDSDQQGVPVVHGPEQPMAVEGPRHRGRSAARVSHDAARYARGAAGALAGARAPLPAAGTALARAALGRGLGRSRDSAAPRRPGWKALRRPGLAGRCPTRTAADIKADDTLGALGPGDWAVGVSARFLDPPGGCAANSFHAPRARPRRRLGLAPTAPRQLRR